MMPSGVDEYSVALDQLRMLAQQDLAKWWANTDGLAPPVRMDTLREAFYAVQATYGEQAAYMAADYLFLQRSLDEALSGLEFPETATPATYEQARAGFNWATAKYRESFDSTLLAVARNNLAGVLNRLVAQPAHTTTANAVINAGTGYARVPEPGACNFCLMLASRGAAYSRESVQTASGFHDNCRCVGIEVKSDDELPRINRDLHELWQSTSKKIGVTPTSKQFQEALLRYRNKTPGWIPFEAARVTVRTKPRLQIQRLGADGVRDAGLLGTETTRADAKRNKQEQIVWSKEQLILDWLVENGAASVERIGVGHEVDKPELATPDFLIDGVTTADGKTTRPSKISDNIGRAERQAPVVLVDVRGSSAGRNEVLSEFRRGIRNHGHKFDRIVVIADDETYFWEAS